MTIATTTAVSTAKGLFLDGTALQFVTGLVVTPGPNSASFAFQTRFPSSPNIEIFNFTNADSSKDMTPENLVTSNQSQTAGVPRTKNHNYRLPHPANWAPSTYPGVDGPPLSPLQQDSHFWFRITADSALKNVVPAVTIGRFWTSKRDAVVTFQELIIFRYGSDDIVNEFTSAVNSLSSLWGADPDNSNYYLGMLVGLYDQVQGLVDQADNVFTSANNNDDLQNPFPDRSLQCPGASDFLWLYAYGQGNQGALSSAVNQFTLDNSNYPASVPNSPPDFPSHGDGDAAPWAEAVIISPRLPDNQLSTSIPVVLNSGNWGTAYELTASINITLTPPRHVPVIFTAAAAEATAGISPHLVEKLMLHRKHILQADSDGALAFGTPHKWHLLVPGAGPTIWVQTRQSAQRQLKANLPWNKLGEGISAPIAILEVEDGTMDIVACGTDGNAWHTRWDGTINGAQVKWHNLGQAMSEEIALVRQGQALDIFLLSKKEEIAHCRISEGDKSATWKSLGGNIVTELKALPMAQGDVHLFGLGNKGDIWHSLFSHAHKAGSKPDWHLLGGLSNIQLSILSDGKQDLVVFAVNKDRMVCRKAWNGKDWSPTGHEWKDLGPLDLLFAPPPTQK